MSTGFLSVDHSWPARARDLRRAATETAGAPALAAAAAVLVIVAAIAAYLSLLPAEAAAVLVLAAGVVAFRRRPDLGFLAWLFLAPYFQSFGRRSETPAAAALKIGLYFLPPLAFAAWTVWKGRWPRSLGWSGVVAALPAVFVALAVASVAFGAGRYGSYDRIDLLEQLYLGVVVGVLSFYVCVLAPFHGSALKRATDVLLATSLLVSVMALVEKATGWNLWHYTFWQQKAVMRATGPLLSPAALGTFLGMTIVLALAALLWPGGSSRRLASVTLLLAVPALVVTYERASVAAALVAALILLALKPRVRLAAAALVVVAGIVLAAAWGPLTHSHLYRSRISNTSTGAIRARVTSAGLRAFERKPLLGWGYGSFDVVQRSLPVGVGPGADLSEVFTASGRGVGAPVAVDSAVVTPARGWVAMRVRLGFGANARISRSPILFSWLESGREQLRLAYDTDLHKFVFAAIAGRTTTYAVSRRQTFRRGSEHTVIGSWSPSSVQISVDGGPFTGAWRATPPATAAPVFWLGSYSGTTERAAAGFHWLAAGKGGLGTGDVRALTRLPDKVSGARLEHGYSTPRYRFTSHNTFLSVLVELGVVGILLLLLPWAVIAGRAVRRAIRVPDDRALVLGWLGVLLVYLVNASFVDMRFFSLIPALSWIGLGLLARRLWRTVPGGPS